MTHLNFTEGVSKTGKTKIIQVHSEYDKTWLGYIHWLGRWRQYVFTPSGEEIVFSWDCLEELKNHIVELNKQQREIQNARQ